MLADELLASHPSSAIAGDLANPQWKAGGRCNNWRRYIPDTLKARWAELSPEARAAAYIVADTAAGNEEWD